MSEERRISRYRDPERDAAFEACEELVATVTGEHLVSKRQRNGGVVILGRTVWTTAFTLLVVVPLARWASMEWTAVMPLALTMFGAIYIAFYTRFASQWAYLAGLYNQIKEFEATYAEKLYGNEPSHSTQRELLDWKCDFIVDARDLHLIGKRTYASAIKTWINRHGTQLKHQFLLDHTDAEWEDILYFITSDTKEEEELARRATGEINSPAVGQVAFSEPRPTAKLGSKAAPRSGPRPRHSRLPRPSDPKAKF